jgi:hypothetical protein
MLTPEEQAFELVVLFQDKFNGIRKELAKKQALKAVDVVIKSEPRYPNNVNWNGSGESYQYHKEAKKREEAKKYWLEVKREIEQL